MNESPPPIRVLADALPPGSAGPDVLAEGAAAITVPEAALSDPSLIRTLTASDASTTKHDLHALSQMALYDFEDGELQPVVVEEGVSVMVRSRSDAVRLERGLVVVRSTAGRPVILVHRGVDAPRLLRQAHRFCTRWIRLDVR